MLTSLGRWVIEQTVHHAQIAHLVYLTFARLPAVLKFRLRTVSAVFFKQIYFTGYESLKVIVPVSMAIGTVIIAQIMGLVGVGNESLAAKVLIWSVVRELGPLLTALIVIARSGAAIATEIGTMKINGEIDTLEILGISIPEYLILPRLFGVMLSVFVLTVYFEIGAVAGGFVVASIGWHLPFEQFSQGLYAAMTVRDLTLSLGKSLLFGLAISAACCQQGLIIGRSSTMVPQAATKGVMHALFLVFIIDGVIAILSQSIASV
jgi:phospholipid/cholesterol/gamma-HCH transport system permease protein